MDRRRLIDYAASGGLLLWDSECRVRWHNLETNDRADWLMFFDLCREEPTPHTEAIIAAIMAGLCPQKVRAANRKRLWYFREGRGGFGPDAVPEFTSKPADSYLTRHGTCAVLLVPVAKWQGRWYRKSRQRADRVHVFDHLCDAWRFLFRYI